MENLPMSVTLKYLDKLKSDGTKCKVFLTNGTMLEGVVTDCDEKAIILDKCLISLEKIISITPPVPTRRH